MRSPRPHLLGRHAGWLTTLSVLCLVAMASVLTAAIPERTVPVSLGEKSVLAVDAVPLFEADRVDPVALAVEDAQREREGLAPRFAIPEPATLSPETDGVWESLPGGMLLWRLRITSPGAVSLNLGLTRYHMPAGGRLILYPVATPEQAIAFDDGDNASHGQLWTPVIPTDDLMVEVVVPVKARGDLDILIGSVNVGYRTFGQALVDKAGTCNVDVVCPEGDDWRDEIPAVGAISTGGSLFCTGFMVNNTAQDQTPFFMTANHCGITSSNAPSLVVYWNFESPTCGLQGGGSLAQNQSGSTFLAAYAASDFTLVRLTDDPDPAWQITFAGWDRSSADPTSATAIHHPNVDEKSISFEYDPLTTTTYLQTAVPGDGTHLRVTDWDVGTTEPGSSGSPLFDQNHHVVGQLHGGYAACDNDLSDWYGRFSVSWTGGGTSSTRLSDWLDPGNTGAVSVDTYNPWASGMQVSGSNLEATGPYGGPFTPSSTTYTLENRSDYAITYSVTADVDWIDIFPASGTLDPGDTISVSVSLNDRASAVPNDVYRGTLAFRNTLDGLGDTTRPLVLRVGIPERVLAFSFDHDPGWSTEGEWAFGTPQGGGGQHGNPDPTAGHTGTNVYGYNLAGDYPNDLPETHLTTTAIDCSDLSQVSVRFRRWLNVEQPPFDRASLEASSDSVTWTTIWENGAEISDDEWTEVEYDLSVIADHQATLYLRWTMGPTDGSWTYSGWNIDDVEIWGVLPDVPAGTTALAPVSPNPFRAPARIVFDQTTAGHVRVTVHDLRGRLVATLLDGALAAGVHEITWDGRDPTGRQMPSGNYFFRLETADRTEVRKGLLVR